MSLSKRKSTRRKGLSGRSKGIGDWNLSGSDNGIEPQRHQKKGEKIKYTKWIDIGSFGL